MTTHSKPETERRFCRYCGEHVEAPCMDTTDLKMYARTITRCSDARFSYDAEHHYETRETP